MQNNQKIIGIFGGGGFIGHHLVKSFGDERKILVLDNFVRGIPERLKKCGSNVKVLKCDITNNKELKDCTKSINIDCIYHLAAINGTGNFYKIPVFRRFSAGPVLRSKTTICDCRQLSSPVSSPL